jgi:hypothetical protein
LFFVLPFKTLQSFSPSFIVPQTPFSFHPQPPPRQTAIKGSPKSCALRFVEVSLTQTQGIVRLNESANPSDLTFSQCRFKNMQERTSTAGSQFPNSLENWIELLFKVHKHWQISVQLKGRSASRFILLFLAKKARTRSQYIHNCLTLTGSASDPHSCKGENHNLAIYPILYAIKPCRK